MAQRQASPGRGLAPAIPVVPFADHGQQAGGGRGAHTAELRQLPGSFIVPGHGQDVGVVLRDALVQPGDFAEQVADDGIGVAGQVFHALAGPATHGGGLERQHDAELAQAAADAVGRDELRRDQPHGVARGLEQPRPVVGAGAGFHADHTRSQVGDELMQLVARHGRADQVRPADLVDVMQGKHVLGEIDTHAQNGHDFPFRMS